MHTGWLTCKSMASSRKSLALALTAYCLKHHAFIEFHGVFVYDIKYHPWKTQRVAGFTISLLNLHAHVFWVYFYSHSCQHSSNAQSDCNAQYVCLLYSSSVFIVVSFVLEYSPMAPDPAYIFFYFFLLLFRSTCNDVEWLVCCCRLLDVLSSRNTGFQMQYQLIFCLWLMAYSGRVATAVIE